MARVLRPTLRISPFRWTICTVEASQATRRAVSAETRMWESPNQAPYGCGSVGGVSAEAHPVHVSAET